MGKKPRCRICKKAFPEQRSVLKHLKSIHKMLTLECKLCNKVFARLDILYKHYISKAHKSNERLNKTKILTNESLNKAGSTGIHDKLVSYNAVGSINDSTSNIEADYFDEDVDEEIDSSLPIIYSYDDEDSILSLNWEDSIEHLKAAAGPVQEIPDAGFNSMIGRADQNPRETFNSTGHSSLPTQFEGNVFTYSDLLRITKGEKDTSNAAGPSNEVHQIRLESVIKLDNDDCITIPSDEELPPDKLTSQAATTPKTKKTLYGESVISPEKRLTEPVRQTSTPTSSISPRRENDVLVDSNVFDLLKKKTLDLHDEDQMFLLSILSDFRRVLPQNKLKVKIKIAQAIADGL